MAVIANGSRPFPVDARLGRRPCPRADLPRVALRGIVWGMPIAGMLWVALAGAAALLVQGLS